MKADRARFSRRCNRRCNERDGHSSYTSHPENSISPTNARIDSDTASRKRLVPATSGPRRRTFHIRPFRTRTISFVCSFCARANMADKSKPPTLGDRRREASKERASIRVADSMDFVVCNEKHVRMYFSYYRTRLFCRAHLLSAHPRRERLIFLLPALPSKFSLFTRGRSRWVVIFRAGTLAECQLPEFMPVCFFRLGGKHVASLLRLFTERSVDVRSS